MRRQQDLCCAYDSDSLFYVTYDGATYKYTDSGQDELLYDSDTVDGSIPQEISYSDGVLYSADIGLRDIIRIPCDMENTGSTDRLTVEESLKEREIAYHVVHREPWFPLPIILLYCGMERTMNSSGTFRYQENCRYGTACCGLPRCSDCRCCFVFCGDFVKDTGKKISFYAKITMAVIGIIVGVAALFIGTLFPQLQKSAGR